MGKLRTNWDEAMTAVLVAHTHARMTRRVFTPDDAFKILDQFGFTLIDSRLVDVLDDMPIGMEDLIEDEDEED